MNCARKSQTALCLFIPQGYHAPGAAIGPDLRRNRKGALEIVVARPKQPDVNLLGERQNGIEYPFVITAEELEKGLAHSKFGAVRTMHADDLALNVKIERFRLGKGLGSGSTYCSKCKNLQEMSMWVTVESGEKNP